MVKKIAIHSEVIASGLVALYCLGAEVYGRLGVQAVAPLPLLARERARGLDPRLRRSTALGLLHSWSGIRTIGLQRGVAHMVAHDFSADLVRRELEPCIDMAELQIV